MCIRDSLIIAPFCLHVFWVMVTTFRGYVFYTCIFGESFKLFLVFFQFFFNTPFLSILNLHTTKVFPINCKAQTIAPQGFTPIFRHILCPFFPIKVCNSVFFFCYTPTLADSIRYKGFVTDIFSLLHATALLSRGFPAFL